MFPRVSSVQPTPSWFQLWNPATVACFPSPFPEFIKLIITESKMHPVDLILQSPLSVLILPSTRSFRTVNLHMRCLQHGVSKLPASVLHFNNPVETDLLRMRTGLDLFGKPADSKSLQQSRNQRPPLLRTQLSCQPNSHPGDH